MAAARSNTRSYTVTALRPCVLLSPLLPLLLLFCLPSRSLAECNADDTDPKKVVCSLVAHLTLGPGCIATVNETLKYPASISLTTSSILSHLVATQSGQKVNVLSVLLNNVTSVPSSDFSVKADCDGSAPCILISANNANVSTLSVRYQVTNAQLRSENWNDGPLVPDRFNVVRYRALALNRATARYLNVTFDLAGLRGKDEALVFRTVGVNKHPRNNVSNTWFDKRSGFETYVIDVNSSTANTLCDEPLQVFRSVMTLGGILAVILATIIGVVAFLLVAMLSRNNKEENNTILPTTASGGGALRGGGNEGQGQPLISDSRVI